jgi:hypothetical protein
MLIYIYIYFYFILFLSLLQNLARTAHAACETWGTQPRQSLNRLHVKRGCEHARAHIRYVLSKSALNLRGEYDFYVLGTRIL